MSKARPLLIHLALGLAGWGIATALSPHFQSSADLSEGKSHTLPTKTDRPRLDVPGGQQILARLSTKSDPDPEPDPFAHSSSTDAQPKSGDPISADPHILWGRLVSIIHGDHGPDLAYAFRHGRMDALEIRDLLAAEYPGYSQDLAFLSAIYHHLAPYDPLRAEVLLDSFPEKQAIGMKYDITDIPIEDPGPEQCYRIFASIPRSENPADIERHRGFVTDCARGYLDLYESDFTHFVEQLPPGQDRDLSLQVIAKAYETSSPAEAARLRALTQVLDGLDGE